MRLIDLYNALLLGTQLFAPAQHALTILIDSESLKESKINAVLLLWLVGSTSKQTPEQQQQLQSTIQAGALQTLVNLLPNVEHCSSATAALLECITRLAVASTSPQLAALWTDPTNRSKILSAA